MGGRTVSHLPYPRGAFDIVKARANGFRPAGPVIVALNGTPDCDNAIVYADPMESYRWDWVKGLPNVVVLIGKETRLGTILADIYACEPGQFDVIDTDRGLGWMVLFTKPKLRTLTLPKHQVLDWLGDGEWHKNLNKAKASYGLATA